MPTITTDRTQAWTERDALFLALAEVLEERRQKWRRRASCLGASTHAPAVTTDPYEDHDFTLPDGQGCTGAGHDEPKDESLWFAEKGYWGPVTVANAKSICATCPVKPECQAFAREEKIQDGIWGGQTPNEMREDRREKTPNPDAA